jgi:hypothetical protein
MASQIVLSSIELVSLVSHEDVEGVEVRGQLHAQAAVPLGKEPPGTQWTGSWMGPHRWVWTYGEVKILDPTGNRTLTPRSSSCAAMAQTQC